MRANPGFTLVAILTLALGIGGNTASFSFVSSLLLKPLPFHDLDRLVSVQESSPQKPVEVTPADYMDWRERNGALAELAGYTYQDSSLSEAKCASLEDPPNCSSDQDGLIRCEQEAIDGVYWEAVGILKQIHGAEEPRCRAKAPAPGYLGERNCGAAED